MQEALIKGETVRMGYDLHISRADDWSQNQGREIAEDEWRDAVVADPSMAFDGDPGLLTARWLRHPGNASPSFYHISGNIDIAGILGPDDPALSKCLDIAGRLNARVQGDDGEFYPIIDAKAKRSSLVQRVVEWWSAVATRSATSSVEARSEFRVGDRAWSIVRRTECTVVKITPGDQAGCIDTITVRFGDGTELKSASNASGLERPTHP